jgi:hypothetical protein
MKVSGQLHTPAALFQGRKASARIGCRLGGPIVGPDALEKILHCREWNPGRPARIARRFTDWVYPESRLVL